MERTLGTFHCKNQFQTRCTLARLSLLPSSSVQDSLKTLSTRNDVAIALGVSKFLLMTSWFQEGISLIRYVLLPHTSNRFFSFQVLLESLVIVSYKQGTTLFWNSFHTIMSIPDYCRYRGWVLNNLKNCSFVPKASLQPHTRGQQFKLILWAPSCLLQLCTEGFGFPDVHSVLQSLAPYIQQLGAIGSPLHTWTHPHHSNWNIFIKGTDALQISRRNTE